jgi:hypothetical protein
VQMWVGWMNPSFIRVDNDDLRHVNVCQLFGTSILQKREQWQLYSQIAHFTNQTVSEKQCFERFHG